MDHESEKTYKQTIKQYAAIRFYIAIQNTM